jgi:hypothetical protein
MRTPKVSIRTLFGRIVSETVPDGNKFVQGKSNIPANKKRRGTLCGSLDPATYTPGLPG